MVCFVFALKKVANLTVESHIHISSCQIRFYQISSPTKANNQTNKRAIKQMLWPGLKSAETSFLWDYLNASSWTLSPHFCASSICIFFYFDDAFGHRHFQYIKQEV